MKQEDNLSGNAHTDSQKRELKFLILRLFKNLKELAKDIFSIKEDIDYQSTIDSIKRDVDFKGYNVYILIFSIFIASIGLNVNSTAVIIGAMLISPLMGPILGVGLAVGINDFVLLKRSLRSLAVASLIGLTTSMVYFLITPIKDQQPELLARTTPTLLDAFVALFGGLAGILASSRKEKSNVVPGVAIATALMPPLCTAGYGLASGNLQFFFGAFYLFFINSIFISIATFVVVKYLKFPVKDFVDKKRETQVKRYIYAFVLMVIIPSSWIFVGVIKKSVFTNQATAFINENMDISGVDVVNYKLHYNDTLSEIEIFVLGDLVSLEKEAELNQKLNQYRLYNTKLHIKQAKDNSAELVGKLSDQVRSGIIEDLYRKKDEEIQLQNQELIAAKNALAKMQLDQELLLKIKRELEVQYDGVEQFAFNISVESKRGVNRLDTVPTLLVKWNKNIPPESIEMQSSRMELWLKARLDLEELRLVEIH